MTTGTALAVAALSTTLSILVARWSPRLWIAAMLAGATAALTAAVRTVQIGSWEWRSTFALAGEPLHFRLDGLSAFFLALLCVVGAAGALFAQQYWMDRAHPRSAGVGRFWWGTLLFSMAFVLLASNGLHFLIGWEAFTTAAYFLITLDRSQPAAREAGWLYLAVSHAAMLALFAFFALLAARTGSWEIGPMRERAELAPLMWLAIFGFGVKAGAFPLHIWLPSAHANAPSHVSAIMSGVSIKLGIYGLMRFTGWLPTPSAAAWTVVALGLASAVLGVVFALGQHDLKRLLAYHSVENIGIILIGLGFSLLATQSDAAAWGQLVLAGAILHVWNHGLFKSLLFLGAGSVVHATGTREMSQLGGLWRSMPWTAGLFGLGAVAICGLPPLNGFVSELLVYLGLFDAATSRAPTTWVALLGVVLLSVTGALALACFVKATGVVFLGAPRSPAASRAHEHSGPMRVAMLMLAGACVAIGMAPVVFWPAVAAAIGSWDPAWGNGDAPVPLVTLGWAHVTVTAFAVAASVMIVRRVRRTAPRLAVTWDCGYSAPTPRMQYTAGSFAGIVTAWFSAVLRPDRHEHLPEEPLPTVASLTEHTPEAVLRYVVEPVGRAMERIAIAARALQHGGVQHYLVYLLVGIVGLAGVVWLGVPA